MQGSVAKEAEWKLISNAHRRNLIERSSAVRQANICLHSQLDDANDYRATAIEDHRRQNVDQLSLVKHDHGREKQRCAALERIITTS